MVFCNDISVLNRPTRITFNLPNTKFPNSNDVFFRTKQSELVEQYSAARIFMYETDTDDWTHWFNPVNNQRETDYARLIFRSHFYETALFYYNAVVDISWTLCYVAIEYACSNRGKRVDINGIKPIEEATELLRKVEGNVTSPTAQDNPFTYLKIMCPEFEPVIDQIISFWDEFSYSEIRKRYNFCKHKGRPAYKEIRSLYPGRLMNIYVKKTNAQQFTQVASDHRDVQYTFSLEDAILELKEFDDNILFPYLQKLINTIEDILNPSPMVF